MIRYFGIASLGFVTFLAGCFGYSVERSSDPARALVVNGGANRYVFAITRTRQVAPRSSPAVPVVSVPPKDLGEIAVITVKAELSRMGTGGLRSAESEFYGDLSQLAAELGATRFHVADKSILQGYIVAMTVSALAP